MTRGRRPTSDHDWLAEHFEEHRGHLRAVAYRMLGSISDADDAVQEAWIRLSRADTTDVENLRAWLTTVVGRIALNVLRSRKTRREAPLSGHLVPDPVVIRDDETNPEHEVLVGDSIGLALLVVLDTLSPAERIAFVLHDVFGVPFDDIAPIVERSPAATRQLASRARRRVRGAPVPDADLTAQRRVVRAFMAAARRGDFEGLLSVLDPNVVLRSDGGRSRPGLVRVIQGAEAVASRALVFRRLSETATPVLVNGVAGVVTWTPHGAPFAVGSFTVRDNKIVSIEFMADPDRMRSLDLTLLID